MLNAVIDISHHNKVTRFSKVRQAGILGVIHKATQGATYNDPLFRTNKQRILDEGLLLGAYHFGVAGDAIAQADSLIAAARDCGALLILDFEPNSQGRDMTLTEAEQFVHRVYSVTGRYPGLYSGHMVKESLAAAGITEPDQTELSKCWLWIAQYASVPVIPAIWKTWSMWQYTDGAAGPEPHQVAGIGRCDRNQFNGTEEELRNFWTAGA